MGKADDMVDRMVAQASDDTRDLSIELFEFEGASIRLLCALALAADALGRNKALKDVEGLESDYLDALDDLRASGVLKEVTDGPTG